MRTSYLDFNHHVNNVKYAYLIVDCFPSSFWESCEITDIRIDYINECKESEKMQMYAKKEDNVIKFCGKTAEKTIFTGNDNRQMTIKNAAVKLRFSLFVVLFFIIFVIQIVVLFKIIGVDVGKIKIVRLGTGLFFFIFFQLFVAEALQRPKVPRRLLRRLQTRRSNCPPFPKTPPPCSFRVPLRT